MSVKSVALVETVDNMPENVEMSEGSEVVNYNIYSLTNDDGTQQFLKLEVIVDSYGDTQRPGKLTIAEKTQKTVTVWA